MKLSITRKALKIIEDDDIRLALLSVEIAQKGNHPWPLHEVAAAAHVIGEDGFDLITLIIGIGAAALLLAFQSAASDPLLG
ncbi:hypothetical protein D9R08_13240 [Rhodophyticola porphyridii]|uniref:Uncharacterized protein n=1 Tax=Rhodophyticola porphyridii TaxID=1852017 RepID=A0A3L9Y434_9RHOB|nr:hypothetical protein D9R08_13240 [Rhodophyticola porphyridii]